uniref:Uncharacterized protein n=1 Tax=Amphimedon queenslandica TaxID=400682 RepID=A0A1X7TDT1_AMPQE
KECEAQDQRATTELTISAEGNQTIDQPPNLSSTPADPSIELQVEDTGTTSTTAGEENAQILALYYAVAYLQSTVVADENEAELDDSDEPTSLPEAEVLRVGDYITQPFPTSNKIRDFKTSDHSPIQTTSASTATVADFIAASSTDNDFSHNEWVLGSNKLPEISNKGEWVVPGASSAHEAAPWEEDTPVEAIDDQGGGGLLVIPPTNYEALRRMNDGENEIIIPPEKLFEPLEDSSDHSSDVN